MREIKFRGKAQVTNDFVYGYYIRQYGCRNGIKNFTDYIYSEDNIYSNDELYYPIDINTLGQYTGLKDKNGVEIYEGDIVDDFGTRCTVIWEQFDCSFQLSCTRYQCSLGESCIIYQCSLGEYDTNTLEVIGNIYDNPELLQ